MSITPLQITGYGGSLPITIANGDQESAALDCRGGILCGIILPADFTGTALTFLASTAEDGDFVPVSAGADGTELSYTVAQGTYCAVDPKDFAGVQFLKIKSGSVETDDRTIQCSLKGF